MGWSRRTAPSCALSRNVCQRVRYSPDDAFVHTLAPPRRDTRDALVSVAPLCTALLIIRPLALRYKERLRLLDSDFADGRLPGGAGMHAASAQHGVPPTA